MLTLRSRAHTSAARSFLPCVPPSLSGPITSPTPPLTKNKKTVLDESVSREGRGGGGWVGWGLGGEQQDHTGPFCMLSSWSKGGAEGGNFLGSDVRLNPDRAGGRGGGGGQSAAAPQALGLNYSSVWSDNS